MSPRQFTIAIGADVVSDLHRRVTAARLPDPIDPDATDDGASLRLVQRLIDRWLHHFSWRSAEARLNRMPQFIARIDGLDVHYVHQRGIGPAPMPLVLTHGWPGSFIEMERILPLLTDPAAHGGDPADAFDVMVPSLPGYGFSQAPRATGLSAAVIANMWATLMSGLGYDRFGAQGGDIGAGVSLWLARQRPELLAGVHVNYIPGSFTPHVDETANPITPIERHFLEQARHFAAENGAYAALHSTKPQTLAYALLDSPVGLAAWMVEKFDAWSDHDGDLEAAIPLDTILTNIALYWFRVLSMRRYGSTRRTGFGR